jgi:hypothetical protein
MTRFRAQSGPFEEQLRFSVQEIDHICLDALMEAKLLPSSPGPVRIERFIERYYQCRLLYEDLGPGAMGCTAFRADGSIEAVIISTRIDDGHEASERRVRSTLAHDGGHCSLHASLFMPSGQTSLNLQIQKHENLDFKARRILCRDSDIGATLSGQRYDGRWWEWQANRAIGGFLLPVSLVRQTVQPFLEFSKVAGVPSLSASKRATAEHEIAEVFDVNVAVARIRLAELFSETGCQMEI